MTEKRHIVFSIMLFVCLIAVFTLYYTDDKIPYYCKLNKDFYNASIASGVVVKKFVDAQNHGNKTVIVRQGSTEYVLLFVVDADSVNFNWLKEKDTITKAANSLRLKIHRNFEFTFIPNCEPFLATFSENKSKIKP